VNNPPPETTNPGKFIFVSPQLLQTTAISSLSWFAGLPPSIQSSQSVFFLFGASWNFGNSNMYLAVVGAQDIEATNGAGGPDTSKWWYYAGSDTSGNPIWSHSEVSAAPLLSTWSHGQPAMDKHSVLWIPQLSSFILHYQDQGLQSRTATVPWGPWTNDTLIYTKNDPTWGVSITHHPGQNAITTYGDPPLNIYDKATGQPIVEDPTIAALVYGGYFFDTYTVNSDGSVTVYFTVSTHVPYQTFLMKTTYLP
jgi:hypothetical protein